MLALHVPLHGPLPGEDGMRLWSEILQVEDTSSEKYSITIDLSCTTCGGPVQNGLRSTAPWLNAQCRKYPAARSSDGRPKIRQLSRLVSAPFACPAPSS